MSYNYTVIISTTEPENIEHGTIWLNPGISFAKVKLGGWAGLAEDDAIAIYTEGTFAKSLVSQSTEPTKEVGLIWHNSATQEYFICLNTWINYAGT